MKRPSNVSDCIGYYFSGIDNATYHTDKDFVSSSQLKEAMQSPENFRWYMHFGNKKKTGKWEKGNKMDFGSLVHAMLLEPETINKEFAFMDISGRNFRTKVDREYLAKFLDFHKNKIVVTNEDKEKAELCVQSLREHPFVNEIMEAKGDNEQSGYYYNEFHDLHLRIRPDRRVFDLRGRPAIIDLKTTSDITKFRETAMFKFHYDLSASMYLEGHKAITGEDAEFYFVVVESEQPHRVGVFKASEQFLARGMEKYQRGLSNVNVALKKSTTNIRWQEADYQEI